MVVLPRLQARTANPLAMILSGVEMLKYLGYVEEAKWVEKGIEDVLRHRDYHLTLLQFIPYIEHNVVIQSGQRKFWRVQRRE